MANTKQPVYDASAIKHMAGAEAVRAKASMYLGDPGPACAFTVLRECTDNVVDEALNGHANHCLAVIDEKGCYWVADNGRGIPAGNTFVTDAITGNKVKMSALQVATGMLHGGAKLDAGGANSAYAVSRGSHGIGQKGTNFTSKHFTMWSCHEGVWSSIGYKDGKLVDPVKRCAAPLLPHNGARMKKGTLIRFMPDEKIIGAKTFPHSMFFDWARIAAYFTPDFTVTWIDMSKAGRPPERLDFHFPEGPKTYVADRVEDLKTQALESEPFSYTDALCDVVLTFTNHDGCDLAAFTNGLRNPGRGVHFDSVLAAMLKALEPLRAKSHVFTSLELREGIVGLVNVKLSSPKFGGQTKDKLVDERADRPLYANLLKAFSAFFSQNKAMTKRLLDRCTAFKSLRTQFTLGKKAAATIKKASLGGLPVNAMTAPRAAPEARELYLLEGESASGSARYARIPETQEVLPMRGKLMNALRETPSKLLTSQTILNILTMLGYVPDSKDAYAGMRVKGKIILLADPDPDGPLHYTTRVPVCIGPIAQAQWSVLTLADIRDLQQRGEVLSVLTFDQARNRVTHARVTGSTSLHMRAGDQVVHITFSDGSKATCTPKHRWVAHKRETVPVRNVSSTGDIPEGDELQFLRAMDLKTGDRIVAFEPRPGEFNAEAALNPNVTAPTFRQVQKVKMHKVASDSVGTQFICLEVEGTHNFALESGVFSGNCHINSLVLALLWKLVPFVFERKMVHVVNAPEFYAHTKTKAFFGSTSVEVRDKLKAAGAPANTEVHHVKGYGEFPVPFFRSIAFDPATRWLSRIEVHSSDSGVQFEKIMSDEVDTRKAMMGI